MINKVDDGYILGIDKPSEWTSFDVVKKIRNITSIRKVGHAGTLDPFASGLLLVCLKKATKLTDKLMDLPKEYHTTLQLGQVTDTLDPTGKIIQSQPVPPLDHSQIKSVLYSFVGRKKQKIPAYSAVKIQGQRSYHLARKGVAVPEKFRFVHIYEIELLNLKKSSITFKVLCGRGTYIRMLGNDIANRLNTVGYLSELRRTRIGNFTVEDALTIPQFMKKWQSELMDESI
jgi:tRNA pseudouridine55 synthase